jgi:DNA-binding transcriptional MerR regulator
MKNDDDTLWTIEQLSGRVAEALRGPGYDGVSSGRVRDVPDLRTIRYYTTLGLLDRPAAMRGRTALYGRRHLFQVVAIKRLQARGLSLAEVQERVVGLSAAALRRLAAAEAAEPPASQPPSPPVSGSRAESFWRVQTEPDEDQAREESPTVQSVPLDYGVVLSLEAGRAMDENDLRVIRMAAAPLIEILRLRGLIGIGPPQRTEGDAR